MEKNLSKDFFDYTCVALRCQGIPFLSEYDAGIKLQKIIFQLGDFTYVLGYSELTEVSVLVW